MLIQALIGFLIAILIFGYRNQHENKAPKN